jgi:hypothetical protein
MGSAKKSIGKYEHATERQLLEQDKQSSFLNCFLPLFDLEKKIRKKIYIAYILFKIFLVKEFLFFFACKYIFSSYITRFLFLFLMNKNFINYGKTFRNFPLICLLMIIYSLFLKVG